jgi:hypothetical protein
MTTLKLLRPRNKHTLHTFASHTKPTLKPKPAKECNIPNSRLIIK